jgi:DNA (cytosine-5)-methyltransferase 1
MSQFIAGVPLVLDVFAGAGGFSLGFQMAGYEILGAVEIDQWACETFAHNHPRATVLQRDIAELTDHEILDQFATRKPDIIIGGPPCQGFSIANRNGGDPKDPRNALFAHFLRFGRLLQPSIMVMENVPNLGAAKTSEGQSVIAIITSSLEALGYTTYSTVLHATNYGVPQLRSRLLVLASRQPLLHPFPDATHAFLSSVPLPDLLDNLKPCPTLWDAISDLPPLLPGEGGEELPYPSCPLTEYQASMRAGSERIFNHKAMNHGGRMVARFSAMKCGDTVNDLPDHLMPRRRNSHELTTNAYDQNNRRMHPDRPCHTIAASFYANFVHPYQNRNFTAREGARIQSFPDWYRFMGKPTVVSQKLLARENRHEERHLCQYSQIGNAVPPLLAHAVALNLKSVLLGR